MRVEIPTSVMYSRVSGRMFLYFFMVLSNADSFSFCFPTFVAPDADLFLVLDEDDFLEESRDVNDAVLFFLLCFAPPLTSRMDSMLVVVNDDGLCFRPNGVGVRMLAEAVDASNMDATHNL